MQVGIGNKARNGAIALLAVITLSTMTAIASAGIVLNASYLQTLLSSSARTAEILKGREYWEFGRTSAPWRMEERDVWLAFIANDTVALKDIVIFKEGVRKMYRSTQEYMDFLNSAYRRSSVRNNYGWSPFYKDYILRFDSFNDLVITFPQFKEIPENVYKRSIGEETDGVNLYILDTLNNRDLYGERLVVNEAELQEEFSDSLIDSLSTPAMRLNWGNRFGR